MVSRDKLIEAAARVYAEHGFRGATTRRIAQEAGVNEVTLFRLFGSKAVLIAEALHATHGGPAERVPDLPDVPADPVRELTAWCAARLEHMRAGRSFIRKTMSELEEHPELMDCTRGGPLCASRQLRGYVGRLRKLGLIDPDVDVGAACAMLMGALFGDAMGRDMMPEMYPHSAAAAPRIYTHLFLRAVGAKVGARPAHAPSRRPRVVSR
ncbi:MAG TPA: helix-turn-helix domain-containing protein [Gemmatimonadaceae bacterium]|nr:helix-turn-helix domain-containing protein [Gemmatimonadaceae bacterium]